MNEQTPDPVLAALFDQTQELPDNNFSRSVMRNVTKHRFRRMALRLLPALVFLPFAPVTQVYATQLSQILMTSLVGIEAPVIAQLLAPINSVAGVLSIALLLLRMAYLRVFLRG